MLAILYIQLNFAVLGTEKYFVAFRTFCMVFVLHNHDLTPNVSHTEIGVIHFF